VPTARRGPARIAVKIDPDAWRDEVERFDARSSARLTAQRERRQLEAEGVPLRHLQRCEDLGDDQTRLPGWSTCMHRSSRPRRPSDRTGWVSLPSPDRG
jgi:hypothetical protein